MSRVLYVAEPAPERDEIATALQAAPHTVKVISPGELMIATVRDWDPDVILMDLAPEGPALPLRIGMLRDPELARVPFIAMGDNEEEARALGAHAFLRTPAPVDGLVTVLGRLAALRMPLPA